MGPLPGRPRPRLRPLRRKPRGLRRRRGRPTRVLPRCVRSVLVLRDATAPRALVGRGKGQRARLAGRGSASGIIGSGVGNTPEKKRCYHLRSTALVSLLFDRFLTFRQLVSYRIFF